MLFSIKILCLIERSLQVESKTKKIEFGPPAEEYVGLSSVQRFESLAAQSSIP